MTTLADPVLQAALDEAMALTGARTGLLVTVGDGGLAVGAAAGPVPADQRPGRAVPARGARAYALASGQPTAVTPSADDADIGLGGTTGGPTTLLVVPGRGAVLIELADRRDGPFTLDDMEAVGRLAAVADAAAAAGPRGDDVVTPARLGAELAALAETAPDRYRDVARAVEALLALGR